MNQPRKEFNVYQIDRSGKRTLAGKTWAVSPDQACNNVRFRLYGETSFDDLAIRWGVRFIAEEVTLVGVPPGSRQLTWLEISHPAFSC